MNNVQIKDEELIRNTVSNKKRSNLEDESLVSALLALDGGQSSKRRRPSTPNAESRDSPPVSTPSSEQRDSLDNDREESSPVSTTKLSHRFMSRFEVIGSSKEDENKVSENRAGTADSNELASAMALASLANQKQPRPNHPRTPVQHGMGGMYPQYSQMQMHSPQMHSPQIHLPQMHPPQMHSHQMHQLPVFSHLGHGMNAHGGAPAHHYNPTAYGYHPRPVKSSPTQNSSGRQWACDFCGQMSFSTYEEACSHEKFCCYNPRAKQPNNMPLFRPRLAARAVSITSSGSHGSARNVLNTRSDSISSPADEDESKFFCGAIKLEVPTADPEWLSEMNCFIRSHCIEAFSANKGECSLCCFNLNRRMFGIC
jgi:hypothetical protein